MGTVASQITSLTIVYSTVDSDADQRKHQSSESLAFVCRGPMNSPQKWPVTRKMFPFDDVIMKRNCTFSNDCFKRICTGNCPNDYFRYNVKIFLFQYYFGQRLILTDWNCSKCCFQNSLKSGCSAASRQNRMYSSHDADTAKKIRWFSAHDDVIIWKHFPCYWLFVRGIHRSPVFYVANLPAKVS